MSTTRTITIFKSLFITIVALLTLSQSGTALASDFNSTNIIDQDLFQNTGATTSSQIQTFLNSQGGFLATWTDNVDMYSTFTYHNDPSNPSSSTTTTAPCLVHKATGLTAAQIIYQAATNWNPYYNTGWPKQSWDTGTKNNGVEVYKSEITGCTTQNNVLDTQPNPVITTVSPQVILTTLQKEQSLLTATGSYSQNSSDYTNATYPDSGNQYALSWAMGYGVPDVGGMDGTKRGFYTQVMYGAWQLRLNSECAIGNTTTAQWPGYEGGSYCGGKTTVGQTISIDGTSTYISNGATASLYSYTPHFSGNQSFVTIFEQDFGPVHPYTYKFVSAVNPPSVMQPGQTVTVSVTLKNTGTQIWWDETNAANPSYEDPAGGGAPTPMRLYTTQPGDHDNPFGGGTGWINQNRMTMLSGKVSPGDSGIFQFSYTAPITPGTYVEHFAPTIENVTKLADVGMAFQVTVPKVYSYQFVSAVNPPTTMMPGQQATATVVLKNTGNVSWGNESTAPTTPFRLFTTRSNDHLDVFGGGTGWVGKNRMTMQTTNVDPGQNGTFTFDYTAPSAAGTYADFFAPTIENVVKLPDTGMEFVVTVPPLYSYKFVSATNPPRTMTKGQTVTATITLMNTGSATWKNDTNDASTPFRLYTTRPTDHKDLFGGGLGWVGQNRMTLQTASASYGQTAVFSFSYTAPQASGTYEDFFAPTVENVMKLADIGMEFVVTVQ